MRICVSGSTAMGKTTFVNDFLKEYPTYKRGDVSYRETIKEIKGDDKFNTEYKSLSKFGNKESQELIRDSIIKDISVYNREDNVIYDRGLLDNIMFSLYLCGKNIVDCDGEWMKKQLPIFRDAFKYYDIIFFIPLLNGYPTPTIPMGDVEFDREVIYRSECDVLFKTLQQDYIDGNRVWLPEEETPAIIEIFGTPEERIQMTKLYLNDDGKEYSEDDSLINSHLEEGIDFLNDYTELHEETTEEKCNEHN